MEISIKYFTTYPNSTKDINELICQLFQTYDEITITELETTYLNDLYSALAMKEDIEYFKENNVDAVSYEPEEEAADVNNVEVSPYDRPHEKSIDGGGLITFAFILCFAVAAIGLIAILFGIIIGKEPVIYYGAYAFIGCGIYCIFFNYLKALEKSVLEHEKKLKELEAKLQEKK